MARRLCSRSASPSRAISVMRSRSALMRWTSRSTPPRSRPADTATLTLPDPHETRGYRALEPGTRITCRARAPAQSTHTDAGLQRRRPGRQASTSVAGKAAHNDYCFSPCKRRSGVRRASAALRERRPSKQAAPPSITPPSPSRSRSSQFSCACSCTSARTLPTACGRAPRWTARAAPPRVCSRLLLARPFRFRLPRRRAKN